MSDNEDMGVTNQVADGTDVKQDTQLVEGTKQDSPQEINWKRANETMSQQSQLIKAREAELAQLREQLASATKQTVYRDKDDVPTYGDLDEETSKVRKEMNELKTQLNIAKIEAREGISVDEMLKKYGNEVPESVQSIILQSGNINAAIDACRQTPSYIRDNFKDVTKPQAQKALDNADKVKVPGSIGTSGSLSKGGRYKNMSSEERIQMMHRYSHGQ